MYGKNRLKPGACPSIFPTDTLTDVQTLVQTGEQLMNDAQMNSLMNDDPMSPQTALHEFHPSSSSSISVDSNLK